MTLPAEMNKPQSEDDYESVISTQIYSILESSIQEFLNARDKNEIIAASNNFNPQEIISTLNQFITKVENWYINEHNEAVIKTANEEGVAVSKWLLNLQEFNWIKSNISNQRIGLENAVNQLDGVLVNYAEYVRKTHGFTGIFNGFVHGLTNPIDAIKGIWGDSSYDREANEQQTALQKSGQQMEESFRDLDNQLRASINSAFANITSTAINEIHYVAEQMRKAKAEEEQKLKSAMLSGEKNVIYVTEKSKSNISKGMIALVVGLLILIAILLIVLIAKR